MSAYLIYDVEIHDLAAHGDFMERLKPLVQQFGGAYMVRGGSHEVLAGKWQSRRLVLFEFPDMSLFTSDEYASLKELRRSCSRGDIVIVEGM